METVEKLDTQPIDAYVRPDGTLLGMYERPNTPQQAECEPDDPSTMINVGTDLPEIGDQVWLFPGWSESPSRTKMREDQWREEQMARITNQLLMIEDDDPDAEPGTKRQWMDYRIALRKWVSGGNPDFPDQEKRPLEPK